MRRERVVQDVKRRIAKTCKASPSLACKPAPSAEQQAVVPLRWLVSLTHGSPSDRSAFASACVIVNIVRLNARVQIVESCASARRGGLPPAPRWLDLELPPAGLPS
jgi:hypothetical protein